MKITERDMMVARAVFEFCDRQWLLPGEWYRERDEIIEELESLPEPAEHEQPAPVATPKWCNVHQHHKWCEHNGGVMGPTGYAAPDEQAQVVTFRTVELDDVAHHALRQAAQDVLDEAPTIQTPDVQTQDDHLIERLRNRVRVSNYEHLAEVAKVDVEEACRRLADVQAQIDAAYRRGVEDGLKRAKP